MTSPALPTIHEQKRTSAASSALSRIFRPSVTDLLFIGILVWAFLLTQNGWDRLLGDADAGLHTRIGDFILQHGYIPTSDPLSFTAPGKHWLASEWLTGVLFSFLNTHFGLQGIVFVCGVTIAATFAVILRTSLSTGANGLLSLVLVLLAAAASSLHFHSRPHVFTWLFLAILMHLVLLDRIHASGRIWLLAPLTVLWTNMHGGFAIVFAVLGIVVVGTLLQGPREYPNALRYTFVGGACGIASLINPFGYKLHLETLRYLGDKSIANVIDEFQAPTFRNEPQLIFMGLLFLGLSLCGLLIAKRKYPETLLILFLSYESLLSVRHIPIYALAATPLIAVELTSYWKPWIARLSRQSIPRILDDVAGSLRSTAPIFGIWTVIALASILFLTPASRWPRDFNDESFPVKIAQRHSAELANARLFTTDQWADYLMFKNPAQRAFVDDRSFYGDPIVSDALRIMGGVSGWRGLLDKYAVNMVLCPTGSAIGTLLLDDGGWILVDRDSSRLLYRRKS